MDPVTLANLLAQLIPLGINIYSQIQQANADQLKPIEQILAAADTNWDAIAAAAQKQIDSAPTA
jgi:prophage tail gpP-like protein